MITITKNEGGEEIKTSVTRGAYEAFYKRLGYSIVENNKKELSAEKADNTPKAEEQKKDEQDEIKNTRRRKISD